MMGVDLPGLLNSTLGQDAKSATLTKYTPGTPTPGKLIDGTNPTATDYPCRGWVESYDAEDIDGTLIRVNDRRISILSRSIVGAVPAPNDKITIADVDGTSRAFTVIGPVQSGPSGAIFVCQGRA